LGKVIRWFLTTVSVGMIPMLMRGLVCLLLIDDYKIQPVVVSDIIVFGLIINISIFNERNGHFHYDHSLSDISSTVSVILIVLFSGMFFFMITNEVMTANSVLVIMEVKPLFKLSALRFVSVLFDVLSVVLCIIYIGVCYPFHKNTAVLEVVDEEEQ